MYFYGGGVYVIADDQGLEWGYNNVGMNLPMSCMHETRTVAPFEPSCKKEIVSMNMPNSFPLLHFTFSVKNVER